LTKPLQYSQVKASLDALGEERALVVLQELEEEAASVPDPGEFVKKAASEAGDAPVSPGPAKKRKAVDEGAEDNSIVAKRIRLLNASGQLAQPITYSQVKDALSSLGVAQAMTILKGLEDVAEDVCDPTAYVRTAVRGAGGIVPADAADGEVEQEEDAGAGGAEPLLEEEPPAEAGAGEQKPSWQGIKSEPRFGPSPWSKAEDFTEAEKIERRINWLNRNGKLAKPITFNEVLPALDCIGFRQCMRVLKRVEESGSTVPDPDEFIKDQVARCGWIWSKPDIVDDDEKVAKRVAWMNLFGGLLQPIDYAEVADILDGLKVPHAMVLLRELEVQAHKVEDPTDYIKRTAGLAGEDDVHVPVVDEDSSVGQRVAELNTGGRLSKAIDFTQVGEDLARIGDEHALALLKEVEDKGPTVKDPTGYIKFKLKAKLASLGTTLEDTADDETKILKRIEWLNDYGGLMQDINYDQVAAPLGAVGVDHAMTVLKELEDKRSTVRDPNSFILSAVGGSSRPRPPARAPPPAASGAKKPPAATGTGDLATLSGFVGFLNKNSKLKKPVKFSDVAPALDALGPRKAAKVLQEMQERGLGLDDPVTYIRAAAQRASRTPVKIEGSEDGDDVARITKRLNFLNQFAGLSSKIKVDEVVGALYCLGLPQSMAILRGLQEKGARVSDPTWYIKAAIQRANGVQVTPLPGSKETLAPEEEVEDDVGLEEPEEPEADEEMEEIGDEEEGAPVEADGYDEGEENCAEECAEAEEGPVDQELPADGEEEQLEEFNVEDVMPAAPALAKSQKPPESKPPTKSKAAVGERRVVGGLTGYSKLIPSRPTYNKEKTAAAAAAEVIKAEEEEVEVKEVEEPVRKAPTVPLNLPLTPQEKLVQVRDYAVKHGLSLDQLCLKQLARLPYFKAKDMVDDVLLGGRNRKGVANPSRYLTIGVQKMSQGLGVEQGIAMELAVSLGVVLNNEALDELACIPRKDSHNIIREIAKNDEARADPIKYIKAEVMTCRARLDSRPFGVTR